MRTGESHGVSRGSMRLALFSCLVAVAYFGPLNWRRDSVLTTSHSLGTFRIGDSYAKVLDSLTNQWGPPEIKRLPCGGGLGTTMLFWEGISFAFQEGRMSGFYVSSIAPNPVARSARDLLHFGTRQGIMVGTTVAEAKHAANSDFKVENDSIYGYTWYLREDRGKDLTGGLSGLSGDDVITSLGAGYICTMD